MKKKEDVFGEAVMLLCNFVKHYSRGDGNGNVVVAPGEETDVSRGLEFLVKVGRATGGSKDKYGKLVYTILGPKAPSTQLPLSAYVWDFLVSAARQSESWWTTRQIAEHVLAAGFQTKNPQRMTIAVHKELMDNLRAQVVEKHVQLTPMKITWRLRPELASATSGE